jgi:hypothetical protein
MKKLSIIMAVMLLVSCSTMEGMWGKMGANRGSSQSSTNSPDSTAGMGSSTPTGSR